MSGKESGVRVRVRVSVSVRVRVTSYCEGARYTPRSSIARCLGTVGGGVGG